MVSGVYVPFRAPIVTRLYSFDRFLLLRGWVPAINMILITFVPGLLIPLVHRFLNDSVLGSSGILYRSLSVQASDILLPCCWRVCLF